MMQPAIFLDRDGTLNKDPGYIGDPNIIELYDGTAVALKRVKEKTGSLLVVISNQSGIARGIITEKQVFAVNKRINDLLKADGVEIDKFYFCPFHPEFNSPEKVLCRKPSPQMVLKAADEMKVNLSASYFIGDTKADILCGKNAGTKTILVRTGRGEEEFSLLQKENIIPNFVALDIVEACEFVEQDFSGD
jgi:D,D-heptose 1,7-bisphosphate phosphatase